MIKLVKEVSNNLSQVETIFRNNDFVFKKESKYLLGKLKDSDSTLYIRLYKDKLECLLYGDFDPHVYKRISYTDFLKRIKEENIFLILLKDKK